MNMIAGVRTSSVRKNTYKSRSSSTGRSMSVAKPQAKKPKRLYYNFKQISTMILQSKKSSTARKVVSKAFIKVMTLRTKYRTGVYDDREVGHALIHAQQLVRVAKKKMKHLMEEERAGKRGGICEGELEEENTELELEELNEDYDPKLTEEAMKKLMQELQQQIEELERAIMEESGLDDLSEELMEFGGDMDPADLDLLKKKHRAQELRDIMEADMKYLKAMFDKLAREKQENSSGGRSSDNSRCESVSLELGGTDVPVDPASVPVAAEGGNLDVMA